MEDQELIALFGRIDERFNAMQQQIDGRFDAMQQQMDGRFDAMQQQMDARIDDVRDGVRALAAGQNTLEQKLDRFIMDTAENFRDVRGEMRYAFKELDQRVSALEKRRK